jgi:hypothetical protein
MVRQAWRGLDAAEPFTREKCPREQGLAAGSAQETPVRRTTCGEMRIRTDTAASASSLTEYLRRCECIVEVVDDRIIDAIARPQSFAAPHADIELEGYLAVWQAMHPECSAERLSPLEHH